MCEFCSERAIQAELAEAEQTLDDLNGDIATLTADIARMRAESSGRRTPLNETRIAMAETILARAILTRSELRHSIFVLKCELRRLTRNAPVDPSDN